MIKSFINSLYDHAIDGFSCVDSDSKECRINICKSCEYFNIKFVKCNYCGCFLDIKTSWATESCPLGKWGELSKEEISSTPNPSFFAKPGGCGCNKNSV